MNNQRLYDRMAHIYAPLMCLLPMWQQYVRPGLPWLDQKQRVLEIGPGPGLLHEQIARQHAFTAGLDLSLGMLRRAQRRLLHKTLTPRPVQQMPYSKINRGVTNHEIPDNYCRSWFCWMRGSQPLD